MTSRPRIYVPDPPELKAIRLTCAEHLRHTRFKNIGQGVMAFIGALGWLWFVYVVFLVDTTLPHPF